MEREFYLPAPDQLAEQSSSNRQGRSTSPSPEDAQQELELLISDAQRNYEHYVWMLNEDEHGNVQVDGRSGLDANWWLIYSASIFVNSEILVLASP